MKKTELMQKMFKSLLTYFIFLLYIHTEGLCERLSKATISPWTLNCFCFSIMSEMKSVRKNMGISDSFPWKTFVVLNTVLTHEEWEELLCQEGKTESWEKEYDFHSIVYSLL